MKTFVSADAVMFRRPVVGNPAGDRTEAWRSGLPFRAVRVRLLPVFVLPL